MKKGYADLHIHTSCSDGLHAPGEIAELARKSGLAWFSITDHDTLAGLAAAEAGSRRLGIGFVPGLELSVEHAGQDFHFLGYWVDSGNLELNRLLGEISDSRIDRAREIVSRLHGLGVPVRFEEVQERASANGTIGRPHVAWALVDGGWVGSFAEAFARYLRVGAPAYVAKQPVDPASAIAILRGAGAVPVLAHPGTYQLNGKLAEFVQQGLQGIETEHPAHTEEQIAAFHRVAKQYDLVPTGGSDFHGTGLSEGVVGSTRIDAERLDQLAARRG